MLRLYPTSFNHPCMVSTWLISSVDASCIVRYVAHHFTPQVALQTRRGASTSSRVRLTSTSSSLSIFSQGDSLMSAPYFFELIGHVFVAAQSAHSHKELSKVLYTNKFGDAQVKEGLTLVLCVSFLRQS